MPYWIARSRAKGHAWSSVPEALGRVPASKHITTHPPIWFHAVSVGEIQSSVPLLRALRHKLPHSPIYVSVGTATGRRLAETKLQGIAEAVFRAPIDLPVCVARVFRKLGPRLLIVAETELWPNYFFEARRFGIPAIIVNGRISDRSAPRYRRLRLLFGPVLSTVSKILVQSDTDRERFLATGAKAELTRVGGNLKYDFDVPPGTGTGLPPDLADFLERCSPEFLFLAGSTREGEESLILPSFLGIAERMGNSLFVVAPRHPHRFDEAGQVLASSGLSVARRSRLEFGKPPKLPAILLLDSLGELAEVYSRADLVFVGGSLNGWGGHNVLEPIAFGKPVIVGPFMQNFRQITADLRDEEGLIQVRGPDELVTTATELALSLEERRAQGNRGRAIARSKQGASERAATEAARLYRNASPTHPPHMLSTAMLGIPAALWRIVSIGRRWMYARGFLRSRKLSLPVVSVGNLTTGGTGKTPTVAWLAEQLWRRGKVSAVLTRGYKRHDKQLRLCNVRDAADPRIVGDEPAMMAARFAGSAPKTRLVVGADRCAAGRLAERTGGTDFLVLDDGFQHLRLKRSLDIVLLDATRPFGNGHTVPLGRLREWPSALKFADAVLITRCVRGFDYATLRDTIRSWNPQVPVFQSRMVPTDIVDLSDDSSCGLNALAGKRVAAFCGIGKPTSFFASVRGLGCEVAMERAYRDHHRYTERDLGHLRSAALNMHAEAFLTTAKDRMNLADVALLGLPAYSLQIELEVEDAEGLMHCILQA